MSNEEQKNRFQATIDAFDDLVGDLIEKADDIVDRIGESIDAGVTAARETWEKNS